MKGEIKSAAGVIVLLIREIAAPQFKRDEFLLPPQFGRLLIRSFLRLTLFVQQQPQPLSAWTCMGQEDYCQKVTEWREEEKISGNFPRKIIVFLCSKLWLWKAREEEEEEKSALWRRPRFKSLRRGFKVFSWPIDSWNFVDLTFRCCLLPICRSVFSIFGFRVYLREELFFLFLFGPPE